MYACQISSTCRSIRVNQNVYQTFRTAHRNRNHYETLHVKPDCTAKDIRDSFVKLSKENHPDTCKNAGANASNFRNIIEAYRVLGKADSRAVYDAVMNDEGEKHHKYPSAGPIQNATGAYYGAFGSKKISNKKIVLYCMIFMVVSAIVQALAIRYSVTFQRKKLDKTSKEAGMVHSKVRANAEEYGNEYQINKLKRKFNDGE